MEERSKLRGESPRSESDNVEELGNSAAGEWTASSARLTASTATLRICKQSAPLDVAEAFAIYSEGEIKLRDVVVETTDLVGCSDELAFQSK